MNLVYLCAILLSIFSQVWCLHITGKFSNKDFFKFLTKFGYQRVDKNNKETTQGYLYGNITATSPNYDSDYDMYLVVVDSRYFLKYYNERDDQNHNGKCKSMFTDIDMIGWDRYCKTKGIEDFLRRVPCKQGELCVEEEFDPTAVEKGSQFTYHISDTNQPRFWYISLVACHRPRKGPHKCKWSYNSSIDLEVSYDIWLVNGNPDSKHLNPFEHQFSYEMHDVLEIYMVFFALNLFLLAVQAWKFRHQKHVLVRLLTAVIVFEVCGIFFNLMHFLVFAFNGEGVEALKVIGNFIDMCAQCIVMLEILFIAKGWTITNSTLTRKLLLYSIWILYLIIYIILFSFTLVQVDPIQGLDEWQTTPGYCILVFRVVIMLYFTYELQRTHAREENPHKRDFYIRVGAGFLVWFIYLPIIALVSPKIVALWRFKTLLSIQSGADFVLVAVLVHLFWPTGRESYFHIESEDQTPLTNNNNEIDELESSEDELYERQARLHTNGINGLNGINKNHITSYKGVEESTC